MDLRRRETGQRPQAKAHLTARANHESSTVPHREPRAALQRVRMKHGEREEETARVATVAYPATHEGALENALPQRGHGSTLAHEKKRPRAPMKQRPRPWRHTTPMERRARARGRLQIGKLGRRLSAEDQRVGSSQQTQGPSGLFGAEHVGVACVVVRMQSRPWWKRGSIAIGLLGTSVRQGFGVRVRGGLGAAAKAHVSANRRSPLAYSEKALAIA